MKLTIFLICILFNLVSLISTEIDYFLINFFIPGVINMIHLQLLRIRFF